MKGEMKGGRAKVGSVTIFLQLVIDSLTGHHLGLGSPRLTPRGQRGIAAFSHPFNTIPHQSRRLRLGPRLRHSTAHIVSSWNSPPDSNV